MGADDVRILATYGFTEAKMAWAECPTAATEPTSGYHLYPDLGIIEIINPETGEVQPPGHPGEIVFTPLQARGSVTLRYRTGDVTDGGLVYTKCPHCHRNVPRLLGRISRGSEIKQMRLDKVKGTLVDFNQLEHILDEVPSVGAWQLELRKQNDDPLEVDELILHVECPGEAAEEPLRQELRQRFYAHTEIHPNQIVFHAAEELRKLHGVGIQLKEQKIIDLRPKVNG